MKYTQGPWESRGGRVFAKGKETQIASISRANKTPGITGFTDEELANCRLLSMSPELLDALEQLDSRPNDYLHFDDRLMIKILIKKAKGEI